VKSLFRNKDVYHRIGLHNPHVRAEHATDLTWALPGGLQASRLQAGNHAQPPFGEEFAQINHYAVRSAQAYLLKRYRGRANHQSHVLDTGYWDRWNRGGCEDTTIHRYTALTQALLDVFKADPVLARMHRRGFRWHKAKLAELLQDDAYAALYAKISASDVVNVVKRTVASANRVKTFPNNRITQMIRPALKGIGTLWIGGPLSFLEQMCLLSFVAQGHKVTLFHYGEIAHVPQDIEVIDAREIHEPAMIIYNKQFGTPVVQSDIFRLHMLRQTNLIWADSDVLCLKPFDLPTDHVFGYFRRRELCNAIMGLPQDSPGLNAYLDYVQDEYPIPPNLPPEDRDRLLALKAAG